MNYALSIFAILNFNVLMISGAVFMLLVLGWKRAENRIFDRSERATKSSPVIMIVCITTVMFIVWMLLKEYGIDHKIIEAING